MSCPSEYFVAGYNDEEEAEIAQFGFVKGKLPVRYLGLTLFHRRLRGMDYSPLTDKIRRKAKHWATKSLSFSGRLQLITSVIYGILNFWFSTFIIPKGCIDEIQSICSRFLWAGSIDNRAFVKVSWANTCLPKEEGGLGLRDLRTWNRCLSMKSIWLLFSKKDSLWVDWNMKHRIKEESFWSVKRVANSSWMWQSLLDLRDQAKTMISCSVGNGKNVNFWLDNWTKVGALIEVTGEEGPRWMGIPITATVKSVCSNNQWAFSLRRRRNEKVNKLIEVVMSVEKPVPDLQDIFYWGSLQNRKENFSNSLTWDSMRPSAPRVTWAESIWFKGAVPKYAFTFWTAQLNRLPFKSRLVSWGAISDCACCLCGHEEENRDHLFLHCEFSEQIWDLLMHRIHQSHVIFTDWNSVLSWLKTRSCSVKTKMKQIAAQVTVYFLWKERNSRLHNSITQTPQGLFNRIDRAIKDILLARRDLKGFDGLLSFWLSRL